jgi:hypothetical protein
MHRHARECAEVVVVQRETTGRYDAALAPLITTASHLRGEIHVRAEVKANYFYDQGVHVATKHRSFRQFVYVETNPNETLKDLVFC